MAMQPTSKGDPALSDEQADQFAASFTPAWDAGDGAAESTAVDGKPPSPATTAANRKQQKQTMIGVAPPPALVAATNGAAAHAEAAAPPKPVPYEPSVIVRPPASSAEAIEPENVISVEDKAAPQPALITPGRPPEPAPVSTGMQTQVMSNRPSQKPAAQSPSLAPRRGVAASDPFQAPHSGEPSSDLDRVPKRSKAPFFVIGGVVVAAALGLILKAALTDDAPKAPTEVVTGPAVPTAEIPPPPPKVEEPPAPAVTPAVRTAEPPPAPPPPPLAAPPRAAEPPRVAAPVAVPNRGSSHGAALPPPPAPASPKTAPKPGNGGIVRDNPF